MNVVVVAVLVIVVDTVLVFVIVFVNVFLFARVDCGCCCGGCCCCGCCCWCEITGGRRILTTVNCRHTVFVRFCVVLLAMDNIEVSAWAF